MMSKRDTTTVTLRLPTDLIKEIDKFADGIQYRNRTHFIEKAVITLINKEKGK